MERMGSKTSQPEKLCALRAKKVQEPFKEGFKEERKKKKNQGGCPGMRWGWSGHWSIHAFFKYCHRFRILSQVRWKASGVTETKALKTLYYSSQGTSVLIWPFQFLLESSLSHTSTKLIKGQLWKQSQNIKPEARPQHRHYWWGRCHFFT